MKKGIATLLVMSIFLPCIATPAYASSHNELLPQVDLDMSLLSAETQETFFEQMELIAMQLRAQNAMEHYDFYADTVYYELLAMEADIMPLADYTFYAPYGAHVSYTYLGPVGQPYISTVILYMDPPKTNATLSDNALGYVGKTTLEGLFVTILGSIPKFPKIASNILYGILLAEAATDYRTLRQIAACDNYSLLQSSAFIGEENFACVLRPWNGHNTVTIPGHVIDVDYEKYEK